MQNDKMEELPLILKWIRQLKEGNMWTQHFITSGSISSLRLERKNING